MPTSHAVISLLFALLPVIVFLVGLIGFDSYKLVRLGNVLYIILLGSVIALACMWINKWLIPFAGVTMTDFARYVAPVVEELAKAVFLIYLIRRKRVGFMVDATIYGFAIGAGFAIIENIYYFRVLDDPDLALWVVRGFGTAIMHGGTTAVVGILSKYYADRHGSHQPLVYVPGLLLGIAIHSGFNHFFLSPLLSALGLLIVLPSIIAIVFRVSETATRQWLGVRFDTDADLLEMITTGEVSESRIGEYLNSLKKRFAGEIVVDMLCLIRLHLELSIHAKGMLLMREAGFNVQPEPEIEQQFAELKYLEKSVGRTGLLAVSPIFNYSDRDLWQLYMLGKR